jgi:predicted nucleic acid-binding protein
MKAWYLDTSAFVKLVRTERYSRPLRRWVVGRETDGDVIASSDILRTEAIRTARRADEAAVLSVVMTLLDRIAMIRIDTSVFDDAGFIGPPSLRSLDALHLAAARELGVDLAGVVAYDERLMAAAHDAGLPTVAPKR